MKILIFSIYILFISHHVFAFQDEIDIQTGWGIEYKFGESNCNFYAFSSSHHKFEKSENRVYFHNQKYEMNSSCIPTEDDPQGKKCGTSHLIIYLIALPASLYLYKEMFELVE